MNRTVKIIVSAALLVACLGAAATLAVASEPPTGGAGPGGAGPLFKAVVHFNFADGERQKHGLKNIANMIRAVGDRFEIVVVCHGPAIGLVVQDQSGHAAEVERLAAAGVRFTACENTMRDRSISAEQLLSGVTTVPAGAVEVVRKQQEGYGYFKP